MLHLHQIISLCQKSLTLCTFVEISLPAVTDNMILIQSSRADNLIRLQEGKAVYFQQGVIPAHCRVFCWARAVRLFSSYWTQILESVTLSHHPRDCYITTGSALETSTWPHASVTSWRWVGGEWWLSVISGWKHVELWWVAVYFSDFSFLINP